MAVDEDDSIWFSEYGEASTDPKDPDQLLYRFNPNTNELCGYSLPDTGDHSYYVLYAGGYIWLGDWEQSRIVRFDPLDLGNTTYWDNDADVGQPRGLAVDPGDSIWWADTASNTIRRLHLTGAYENRITVYTPPVSGTPQMVALEG